MKMQKTLFLGTGHFGKVFISVKIKEGNLSITGVEGPLKSGNCKGSCGQIRGSISLVHYAENWNEYKVSQLLVVWEDWHLNDMRAGCKHQRTMKWNDKRIDPKDLPKAHTNQDERGIMATWITEKKHKEGLLCKACPECNYKYGTKWLKQDLPDTIITYLENLPESKIVPAWI